MDDFLVSSLAQAIWGPILAILATWRISALFYFDYGPGDIFLRLRGWAKAGEVDDNGDPLTFLGGLLDCFWCVSIWSGIFCMLLLISPVWWLLIPFALSGGTVLLSKGGDVIRESMEESEED